MATNVPTATPAQPPFKRIQQTTDFDCVWACISSLTGKTIEEVKKVAVDYGSIPEHGPYWMHYDVIISKVLVPLGWTTTEWRESKGYTDIEHNLAICLTDYSEETELGRAVLFCRTPSSPGAKTGDCCVIDPAFWIESSGRVGRFVMHSRIFALLKQARFCWLETRRKIVGRTTTKLGLLLMLSECEEGVEVLPGISLPDQAMCSGRNVPGSISPSP